MKAHFLKFVYYTYKCSCFTLRLSLYTLDKTLDRLLCFSTLKNRFKWIIVHRAVQSTFNSPYTTAGILKQSE